jgi:DNA-binding NarL/FixJ family response regulator
MEMLHSLSLSLPYVLMITNQDYHRYEGHSVNDSMPMHPTRVVIADNQTVARLGTHQLLEQTPSIQVVGEARSGQEALHLVRTKQVDVLIAEMRLPDLSGVEIAEHLAQDGASVSVLILSAYEDEAAVRQILSSPIAGYLLKSDTAAHVTEAVLGAAREETGWLSPSVARRLMKIRKQQSMLEACELTTREREALEALMQGLSNEQIADALHLSVGTVKNHLTKIYEKLNVASRAEAIVRAHSMRLGQPRSAITLT